MTLDVALGGIEYQSVLEYVGVFVAYGLGAAFVAWMLGLGIWFIGRFFG